MNWDEIEMNKREPATARRTRQCTNVKLEWVEKLRNTYRKVGSNQNYSRKKSHGTLNDVPEVCVFVHSLSTCRAVGLQNTSETSQLKTYIKKFFKYVGCS